MFPSLDPIAYLNRDRPWHGLCLPNPSFAIREQGAAMVLAMACWGEARDEGALGMLLFACVVRNRVAAAPRYGQGWLGVLCRPYQVGCFDPDDRRYAQVRAPLTYDTHAVWEHACCAAYDVMEDRCRDLTDGATHRYGVDERPWTVGPVLTPTVTYGRHVYCREAA